MIEQLNIKVELPYSTYFFSLDMLNESEKIICHAEDPIDGDRRKYEFKSQQHAWMCLKDKIEEVKNKDIKVS